MLRFIKSLFAGKASLTPAQRRFWDEHGYLVLPGFFSQDRVNEINRLVDTLWRKRTSDGGPLVVDVFLDTPKEKRMYFKDAPEEAQRQPYKLNDLFLEYEQVRQFALAPELTALLHDLLDGDPLICNSLTLEFGSQQVDHFDTFYMPPCVANKMLASWIALEDVTPDAGPLQYYPGSHTLPPYRFSHGQLHAVAAEMPACHRYIAQQLTERQMKPEVFLAKAGDVFIWHAQLLHGGTAIANPSRTRRSLVTHYFRAQDYPGEERLKVGKGSYYMKRKHQPVG